MSDLQHRIDTLFDPERLNVVPGEAFSEVVPVRPALREERGTLTRWFAPHGDPQSGYVLGLDGDLVDGSRLEYRLRVTGACERARWIDAEGVGRSLDPATAAAWLAWLTETDAERPPLLVAVDRPLADAEEFM